MSPSPEKSVSYIIGGSSGMGLATANLLVADSATVVVIGRDAKKLERRGFARVQADRRRRFKLC